MTNYEKIEKIKTLKTTDMSTKNLKVGEFIIDRFEIGLHVFFANLFKWNGKDKGWDIGKYTFYYEIGDNCETWEQGITLFLDAIIERIQANKSPYLIDIVDLSNEINILNNE
jgi:hypothetical protein